MNDKQENPVGIGKLFVALVGLAAYIVAFFALCKIGFYFHPVAGWGCLIVCCLYSANVISSVIK